MPLHRSGPSSTRKMLRPCPPEWLRVERTPIMGFDYAVFRPAGIYTVNPRMERYFRAVRWLQTVPFDLKRDDHLASMALVIAAFEESTGHRDFASFHAEQARRFKRLLGEAINPATNRPLAKATIRARLMAVKAFVRWLSQQSGYKSKRCSPLRSSPGLATMRWRHSR